MADETDENTEPNLNALHEVVPVAGSSMTAQAKPTQISPTGLVDRDGTAIDISTVQGASRLFELMSQPTSEEIAFFEDRDRRGLGVGRDEFGKIVSAEEFR